MAIIELELKVPQKLEAIKLRQYQEYLKIQKDNKDTEDNGNFLNSKCIQIFCGLTLKESYNLPVKMFDGVLNQIGSCFEEKTPLIKEFSMTGSNDVEVSFGMIPSLDEMTFGEYVDLENFISDWDSMHKAMAVLYRPIKYNNNGKYLIEDYDGSDRYWEVMKDAPVNVSLGAMVFFYRLGKKLCKYTMDSLLLQQKQNQTSTSEKALERNGDGINQFMLSLEKTYQELVKSQKFHYTNV
tara:strand:+ start:1182 stop:1898 length:717 start_codon:yes stop_codon:yes gene_type:complete